MWSARSVRCQSANATTHATAHANTHANTAHAVANTAHAVANTATESFACTDSDVIADTRADITDALHQIYDVRVMQY